MRKYSRQPRACTAMQGRTNKYRLDNTADKYTPLTCTFGFGACCMYDQKGPPSLLAKQEVIGGGNGGLAGGFGGWGKNPLEPANINRSCTQRSLKARAIPYPPSSYLFHHAFWLPGGVGGGRLGVEASACLQLTQADRNSGKLAGRDGVANGVEGLLTQMSALVSILSRL